MNYRALIFLAGLLFGAIIAYGLVTRLGHVNVPSSTANLNKKKLSVVTSIYPLYFFATAIGGEEVEVNNLIPAGAEPHDYELIPRDIARLQESQVVVLNGGVEPWINGVKESLSRKPVKIVIAGEGLFSRETKEEGGGMVQDPHIWLSPRLAQRIVDRVAEAFIAADVAHAEVYRARATELRQKLTALDAEFTQRLRGCAQTTFVTSHSAFGYLAAEYGLTQIGIAGLSPEAEPSPRTLAEIVNFAKTHNIKYIFFETLVNPKLADTLAKEVGAQTLVLNPLEGLTPEEVAGGKDYFTEMRQNLAHLRLALTCPALNPTK